MTYNPLAMFEAIRRFFASPRPLATHQELAIEAAAAAKSDELATLIVLAEAAYLPHGGRDRVALRLRADGGFVERTRMRYEKTPRQAAREVTSQEGAQISSDLGAWDVWSLRDHDELALDGLVCGFAFAEKRRVHSFHLHGRHQDSKHLRLLHFLTALAPLDDGD
jgi:hypothetical protein